jgi:uncharacterized membrane protein
MNHRMTVAVLALGGIFLAAYLTLFHYGYIGTLACGTGGCETVQTSRWSVFLGLPVALWGAGFYVSVFAVAMAGSLGAAAERGWPTRVLLALTGWGVLFSGYLTWAEIARIHAICRWCVGSACITVALLIVTLLDARARSAGTATPAA